MIFNPTTIQWRAPTENTDGTPIQRPLDYELGVVGANDILPYITIVGTLQPDDGVYQAPFAEAFSEAGVYGIALRTVVRDDPSKFSAWTDVIEVTVSDEIPNRPLEFSVY